MGISVKNLNNSLITTPDGYIQTWDNTTRTYGPKFRIPNSPEAYGAIGDGVADDTSAVQAALDNNPYVECIGSSTYKITNTIDLNSNNILNGNGCVFENSTDGYVNLFDVNQKDFVTIDNIQVNGNDNGYGTSLLGHCVFVRQSNYITISNSRFFGWGAIDWTPDTATIRIESECSHIMINNNLIKHDVYKVGVACCYASDTVGGAKSQFLTFTNNTCEGEVKNGIYINLEFSQIIISNNMFKNMYGHGVLTGYTTVVDENMHITVANNAFYNCEANAIYSHAWGSSEIHIANNTFSFCGGRWDGGLGIGDINVFCPGLISITNNHSYKSGYEVDGITIRPYSSACINAPNSNQDPVNITIIGNTFESPASGAMTLASVNNAIITNNFGKDVRRMLFIEYYSNFSAQEGKVIVSGNIANYRVGPAPTNLYEIWNTSKLIFTNNISYGNSKVNTNSTGIRIVFLQTDTITNATITNNTFENFYYAIELGGFPDLAHDHLGGDFSIRENMIKNCAYAFYVPNIHNDGPWFFLEKQYVDPTTQHRLLGGVYTSRFHDAESISNLVKHVYSTALPIAGDGSWNVGDRITNRLATSSPFAWVCTVAGDPGTWTVLY